MGDTRVADTAACEVLVGAAGGSARVRARAADRLAAADAAGRAVSETASHLLVSAVASRYEQGWQPLDLLHVVALSQPRRVCRLLRLVVLAEADRACAYDQAPRAWVEQLEGLDPTSPSADPVADWRRVEPMAGPQPWDGVIRLLGELMSLAPLTEVLPRPSRWDGTGVPHVREADVGDPKVLARIRALLAKAQSTTYPAEAEALAAKAQQLMTRHAVESAVLGDATTDGLAGSVVARRIRIEDPYARPKSQLFHGIASANGVRAVAHPEARMATAVGLAADLDLVEMLFTSLLVQAHRAMTCLAAADEGARERTFRRGFLIAYAVRIGQRLQQAARTTESEMVAAGGGALVPVLTRRREAVDRTYGELFPRVRMIRASPVDARGWSAGVAAADRADVSAGSLRSRLPG